MGTNAAAVVAKSAVLIPLVGGTPNKLPILPEICCAIDPKLETPLLKLPVVPAAIDALAVSAMFLKEFSAPLSVPGNPATPWLIMAWAPGNPSAACVCALSTSPGLNPVSPPELDCFLKISNACSRVMPGGPSISNVFDVAVGSGNPNFFAISAALAFSSGVASRVGVVACTGPRPEGYVLPSSAGLGPGRGSSPRLKRWLFTRSHTMGSLPE